MLAFLYLSRRGKNQPRPACSITLCVTLIQHQAFSKHVDPETGYWFYENLVTGERHWDRPLAGVQPLQPKSPRHEEKLVDDA